MATPYPDYIYGSTTSDKIPPEGQGFILFFLISLRNMYSLVSYFYEFIYRRTYALTGDTKYELWVLGTFYVILR
jgi:hypothetical protein